METEAVKVFCRIKPVAAADEPVLHATSTNAILRPGPDKTSLEFAFSGVLGPEQSNADVFSAIGSDACKAVLAGYNGAILAFGQTASGKTHTILGSALDPGLIPRSMERLFHDDQGCSDELRTVRVAFTRSYPAGADCARSCVGARSIYD